MVIEFIKISYFVTVNLKRGWELTDIQRSEELKTAIERSPERRIELDIQGNRFRASSFKIYF
ncbi:hypothetical protein IQ255_01530 [Pleurocapsales cyanobacterium LEGE 10410]|nr:hypothetical protein [Pleurocapsales cyanobacterium LEGE 10410]